MRQQWRQDCLIPVQHKPDIRVTPARDHTTSQYGGRTGVSSHGVNR